MRNEAECRHSCIKVEVDLCEVGFEFTLIHDYAKDGGPEED